VRAARLSAEYAFDPEIALPMMWAQLVSTWQTGWATLVEDDNASLHEIEDVLVAIGNKSSQLLDDIRCLSALIKKNKIDYVNSLFAISVPSKANVLPPPPLPAAPPAGEGDRKSRDDADDNAEEDDEEKGYFPRLRRVVIRPGSEVPEDAVRPEEQMSPLMLLLALTDAAVRRNVTNYAAACQLAGKLMRKFGARTDLVSIPSGWTALLFSVRGQLVNIAREILNQGTKTSLVGRTYPGNFNILHIAAASFTCRSKSPVSFGIVNELLCHRKACPSMWSTLSPFVLNDWNETMVELATRLASPAGNQDPHGGLRGFLPRMINRNLRVLEIKRQVETYTATVWVPRWNSLLLKLEHLRPFPTDIVAIVVGFVGAL